MFPSSDTPPHTTERSTPIVLYRYSKCWFHKDSHILIFAINVKKGASFNAQTKCKWRHSHIDVSPQCLCLPDFPGLLTQKVLVELSSKPFRTLLAARETYTVPPAVINSSWYHAITSHEEFDNYFYRYCKQNDEHDGEYPFGPATQNECQFYKEIQTNELKPIPVDEELQVFDDELISPASNADVTDEQSPTELENEVSTSRGVVESPPQEYQTEPATCQQPSARPVDQSPLFTASSNSDTDSPQHEDQREPDTDQQPSERPVQESTFSTPFQNRLDELYGRLDGPLPATLDLKGRSLFTLGYHQQRAQNRADAEAAKNKRDKANSPSDDE